MVIAPGKFATIGSQNLTRNGVNNKEASLITFDEKEIYKIEHALDKWLVQRQLITLRMIESLEKKLQVSNANPV
jgi:glucose-6-phosphate 1-dehydrogenase